MSEINRNAGRKAWLLSSASGAVLLAGMVAMTPQQASAACFNVAGTILCGGASGNVTGTTPAVVVVPTGGGSNFTLNVGTNSNTGTVQTSGDGVTAIFLRSFNLNVTSGSSITGGNGVVSTVTGNIVVDNKGKITGSAGDGIRIGSQALPVPSIGNVTVTNTVGPNGQGLIKGSQNGISVFATGELKIDNKGGIVEGINGDGVQIGREFVVSGTTTPLPSIGNATVTNANGIISGGQNGISAFITGDLKVENTASDVANGIISGTAGDGIRIGREALISGTTTPVPLIGNATVSNTGGTINGGQNGISAFLTGDLKVDNNATGPLSGTIIGGVNGIKLGTTSSGLPVPVIGNVSIQNGADSSILGTTGSGIVGSASGQIDIANAVDGSIGGGTDAINVLSLLKDVNIENGGGIGGGQNGVIALALAGNVVLGGVDNGDGTFTYGDVDATAGTGVFAAAGGSVTIDAGAVDAGGAGVNLSGIIPGVDLGAVIGSAVGVNLSGVEIGGGVVGVAVAGDATVNLHGDMSVDDGLFGAAAIALGNGTATVTLEDNSVEIDPPLIGTAALSVNGNSVIDTGIGNVVDATLAGAVGLNFGAGGISVNVGDGTVIGDTDVPLFGIVTLDTDGAAATTITLGADSLVRGQSSGVVAMATEAEVRLTSKGGTILGGGGALSPAVAMMSGVSNVINNQTGDLGGVHHRGTIGQAGANGDFAIFSAGGELSLVNQGDIHGRIVALTTDGGSNVFVNSMSASPLATQGGVWNTSGISVFAATGASGGNAIVNHDKAAINVTGNAAIGLVSEGGANTVTNEVGGVININAGATPGLSTVAALGLASETGDNTIDNQGTMNLGGATVIGFASEDGSNRLDNSGTLNAIGVTTFGFASETGSNEFDNHGTFRAEGVTTLGFATDTGSNWVHNASIMNLTGITTFAFTAPTGASEFDNDGVMNVNGLASFAGLDTFHNNNLINMANGIPDWGMAPSPYYGSRVGDITAMTGDFNAGAGSKLAIDAILAGRYNSASDLLVVGGDVTGGPTAVQVNFDPTAIAEHNPFGTPVVGVVGGNTALGDFYLANGPIDRGLFRYDLFLDEPDSPAPAGSKSWVLASYADGSAYALSEFAGLAQGIWNTTSDSWIDRAGDLRVSSQQGPGDPAKKTGIWGRFIGNGAERSTERTITPFQNQSVTIDTGYDQTLWGFQVGLDHEFEGNVADGVLIAGVLGGYVSSNADFNSGDSVRFSGPQVGVYASWVKGGLYVDGLVKGDFLKADYNVAGSDSDTDSTTIGVRVETGYRYFTSTGMFIEPNASLAYAHTSIDDVTVAGTPVRFDDGDGLEGKLGARFGGSSLKDGVKYDPYLSVGIAGNLLSDNSVFFSSGPGLVVEDDAPDVFGEVGAGINIFSTKSGWTGFAKADLRFGDDYVGGTGKIGVNWAW